MQVWKKAKRPSKVVDGSDWVATASASHFDD